MGNIFAIRTFFAKDVQTTLHFYNFINLDHRAMTVNTNDFLLPIDKVVQCNGFGVGRNLGRSKFGWDLG